MATAVSSCVAVTVMPGSTPPLLSVTVPTIEPVSICAAAWDAESSTVRTAHDRDAANVWRFMRRVSGSAAVMSMLAARCEEPGTSCEGKVVQQKRPGDFSPGPNQYLAPSTQLL